MLKLLFMMVLTLPPDFRTVTVAAPAECREADSAACRAVRETVCRRDVDGWVDRLAGRMPAVEAAPVQREARERIARNRREGVPECQTFYELNGGRDRCKHSDTPACQAEKQSRCRAAADAFLQHVASMGKSVAAEVSRSGRQPPDFAGLVRDNRRRGIDDCRTWADLGKMAATQ